MICYSPYAIPLLEVGGNEGGRGRGDGGGGGGQIPPPNKLSFPYHI